MRESGEITLFDPLGGSGTTRLPTLQCVHCGRHWVVQPGSGRVRGFCARCNGPFCGPDCEECVPAEQQLENVEDGRPLLWRPTRVAFPVQRLPKTREGEAPAEP